RWMTIPVIASAFMSAGVGRALGDEALAKKSGCFECHDMNKRSVGPSFKDIAGRYKNVGGPRAKLIETMKKGGKGNWSDVSKGAPMPPYSPRLSDAEIEHLVDWVLGL